jgi:hypothetical protein
LEALWEFGKRLLLWQVLPVIRSKLTLGYRTTTLKFLGDALRSFICQSRSLDHSMWAIGKLTSRAREAAGVGSGPLPRPSRRASLWATAAKTPTTSMRITPSGSVELNLQSRDDHRTF